MVIVYCRTRDQTEDIANLLNKKGLKSLAYHGGNSNITLQLNFKILYYNLTANMKLSHGEISILIWM